MQSGEITLSVVRLYTGIVVRRSIRRLRLDSGLDHLSTALLGAHR